jgi:hypothetical protein
MIRTTTDGRSPVDNVTQYFDVAVHQVRAKNPGPVSRNFTPARLAPCLMGVDELTILTGWMQPLAEALAYAPESARALLAEAHAGAPWRPALRMQEPSRQFTEAIACIERVFEALRPADGTPTFDQLVLWCREDRPGEEGLDKLILRVLRSTLDQLRTRPAKQVP